MTMKKKPQSDDKDDIEKAIKELSHMLHFCNKHGACGVVISTTTIKTAYQAVAALKRRGWTPPKKGRK